jgi:hypothetical protein
MRRAINQTLVYRQEGIQLSKQEMATLAAASRIAEEARERARAIVGPDFEDDDTDLWLAEIEHNALSFSVDGFIVLKERVRYAL